MSDADKDCVSDGELDALGLCVCVCVGVPLSVWLGVAVLLGLWLCD